MTKDQIKVELRRSACEDAEPFLKLANFAFIEVDKISNWRNPGQFLECLDKDDLRTFFLLVAEAL
jgi:hypothetical protein